MAIVQEWEDVRRERAELLARWEGREKEIVRLRAEVERLRGALDVRPEVLAFARHMEARLRENDHKGGWRECGASFLFARLHDEVRELVDAWTTLPAVGRRGIDVNHIAHEAADVANFAMMIADVHGCLSASPPSAPTPRYDRATVEAVAETVIDLFKRCSRRGQDEVVYAIRSLLTAEPQPSEPSEEEVERVADVIDVSIRRVIPWGRSQSRELARAAIAAMKEAGR